MLKILLSSNRNDTVFFKLALSLAAIRKLWLKYLLDKTMWVNVCHDPASIVHPSTFSFKLLLLKNRDLLQTWYTCFLWGLSKCCCLMWILNLRRPPWPLIGWHFQILLKNCCMDLLQTWHKCSLCGSYWVLLLLMWICYPRWSSWPLISV